MFPDKSNVKVARGRCLRIWLPVIVLLIGTANFSLYAQDLIISEIMYHPVDASGLPVDGDEYEFLELYNQGVSSLSLSNAYFSKGITYTFPEDTVMEAGSYGILVYNEAAFTSRYPLVTNVIGVFTGHLDNGGEEIKLKDANDITLCSVTYNDSGEWPVEADGYGASLAWQYQGVDLDIATNWTRSYTFWGSPGASNRPPVNDVVLNEILAHTDLPLEDAIELYNASTNAVSVEGWYVSDDPALPEKYLITNGAIAASAYQVLYEYQFNDIAHPSNTTFALSSMGDDLYLTAPHIEPGAGLRLVDYAVFDASDNGVSFGRYPNGVGNFVAMDDLTLGTTNPPDVETFRTGSGASNALPRVGPVVISEIMYHTVDNDAEAEYIELLNISTNTVPLYDPLYPTNTWKVTDEVDYILPEGISMLPDERILLVGTTNILAFRQRYSLSTNIIVLGAWSGNLSNGGGLIGLYKPDPPGTNGITPYILVENINYDDQSPWPTAPDGYGPSLERIDTSSYGNTSLNWYAGSPEGSPGTASEGGFINPQFMPETPIPNAAFTATVSVVAETLPTQVVMRLVVNDSETIYEMKDDGIGADEVSGDQIYSVELPGQADGSWMYYRLEASGINNQSFVWPAEQSEYKDASPLQVRMALGSVMLTVEASNEWQTASVWWVTSDTNELYIYLEDMGEVLIDDVAFYDTNAVNHVINGDFELPLGANWTAEGNHDESSRKEEQNAETNHVLHIISKGVGDIGGSNRIVCDLDPSIELSEPVLLTLRIKKALSPINEWEWMLIGTNISTEIVINEIMYHPDQSNEVEELYEYIELYNPGSLEVDLSDWMLKGVGSYAFPTGTVLSASNYVVLCVSTSLIESFYSITNVIGNWTGKLQNDGETLTLLNSYGRTIDAVSYDDREPWAAAADGYGPSLERRYPWYEGNTSINWSASSVSTNWQQVSWTQTVVSGSSVLSFWLDYEGKCLLDDVSIHAEGDVVELVTNGAFEAGMNGWSADGNHGTSRVEPDLGHGGSNAMVVVGNMSRFIESGSFPIVNYGDSSSNALRSVILPTLPGSNYVVSFWVKTAGVGKSIYSTMEDVTNRVDLGHDGTPGIVNSCYSMVMPMGASSVTSLYKRCSASVSNIIYAHVENAEAVSNVWLQYRTVGTNDYQYSDAYYLSIQMNDDGVFQMR